MKTLWRRIHWWLNRAEFERELDEELRHHLDMKAGSTAQFGNVTLIKEDSRLMWLGRLPEQIAQDIRYGVRAMANNKLFTAMAVLSLALGIGANTAIYSYVDAVLVRALPVRNPENLVILNWHSKGYPEVAHSHHGSDYNEPGGYITSGNFPFEAWEQLRDHNTAMAALFGFAGAGHLNVMADGQAESSDCEYVSGGFFDGLGVLPAAGRLIGNSDDRPGASRVAVLSYDVWKRRFAGNSAAIGRTVLVNNQPFTVIGVAAPEFFGVSPGHATALYIPLRTLPLFRSGNTDAFFHDPNRYWIEAMGRLRQDVSATQAQTELGGMFHRFVAASAKNDKERANLPSLWLEEGGAGVDALRRQFSKPLYVLMTMVALILAIACANIANLLLSRATARRREMAVRLSLGAGRGRVIRQLLTESVMLAFTGGMLGIVVAAAGIRFLNWLVSLGEAEQHTGATLDLRVLGFTLLVSLFTGILFGLAPAFAATKVDVTPALKETRAAPARRRRFGMPFGLTHVLMVTQIAVSLLLVISAGLFVRTLGKLHSVDLGFNQNNVLLFSANAHKAGYAADSLPEFYRQLQQRIGALPGVRAATMTTAPLVAGWSDSTSVHVPGIPEGTDRRKRPSTSYTQVGPEFFGTMEIPILAGRPITERDSRSAPTVAVVNEVFVKRYFAIGSPIGRHFSMGRSESPTDIEIVGVARTARYNSLKRETPPVTYLSWAQSFNGDGLDDLFFEVRTAGDPLLLANSVRKVVHDFSPTVPVTDVSTQSQRIDSTISQELIFARLCTCFAVLALLIACVGLYGTMAYGVARRTGEIGIRVALGASRRRIGWLVMSEVLIMTGVGLATGFAAARASGQFVASFLFDMKPTDPVAFIGSTALLGLAALLAGYAPAWRASRIDPMAALRHE